MRETRKCVICGKSYIAIQPNSKYCSRECLKVGDAENKRYRRKSGKKSVLAETAEMAAKAKAAGVTYGQLQKQETIKQLRESGFWERKNREEGKS